MRRVEQAIYVATIETFRCKTQRQLAIRGNGVRLQLQIEDKFLPVYRLIVYHAVVRVADHANEARH